jgi:hypothetical protein
MTTVVGTRLTDAERLQVVAAARRLGLSLSEFARQALLASSAQVERKATVRAPEPELVKPIDIAVPVIDADEEHVHVVDGVRVLPDGRIVDWDEPDE